ncbi:hypothetical protein [Mucilaginibacter aquatilis]|uniref:Outer membrane protein beta-barrel domain-containing protein n=1 Tax=Mucilaginibacter aquatilis TaxID=1517760 RepID=A0A6I4IPN0_9SPHI|nr:hypothetical protein [Mucilaginibacter aquatilis]MVN90303.1 hypothetical protein [Mucilaginibacter aquatilis]
MNRMKLLLLMLLPSAVFAQAKYLPGYVVESNGDTLKGVINYHPQNSTPKYFEFKANPEQKTPVVYTPTDVKAINVLNAATFITYSGKVSMDKNKFPDIPTAIDTITQQQQIFLKVTYIGDNVGLAEQEDATKHRYFLTENNTAATELIYYQYYANIDGSRTVRTAEMYKQTLKNAANRYSNNLETMALIDNTTFTASSLTRVLKLMNKDNKVEEKSFVVGIHAGVSLNAARSGLYGNSVFTGDASWSYLPRVLAGIELSDHRILKNLRFKLDFTFTGVKPRFNKTIQVGATNITNEYSYEIDHYYFSAIPNVTYNIINSNRFRLFAGVGLSLNYGTSSKITFKRNLSQFNDLKNLQSSWTSTPLQLGVTLNKRLDIYGNFTYSNRVMLYDQFFLTGRHFDFGLRYRITKAY